MLNKMKIFTYFLNLYPLSSSSDFNPIDESWWVGEEGRRPSRGQIAIFSLVIQFTEQGINQQLDQVLGRARLPKLFHINIRVFLFDVL